MGDVSLNPYAGFVADLARVFEAATRLPHGGLPAAPHAPVPRDAPRVAILAPHPDDECVTGALPLRLRREASMRVVDVAITLGGKVERRAARQRELENACAYLGFELALPTGGGLDKISPASRTGDPAHWARAVEAVAAVVEKLAPQIIVLPHGGDWHSTHVGTSLLGCDVFAALGSRLDGVTVVETEFWGALADPNLMVESSLGDLGDLCAAASFHAGEVARNPYHVRLPAMLYDNVRRGGELVGGQGHAAPPMQFATLYRLRRLRGGQLVAPHVTTPRFLPIAADPRSLL